MDLAGDTGVGTAGAVPAPVPVLAGTPGLTQWTQQYVTWLRLERPERLNSFTGTDYRDLRVALERAAADDDVRVIVVTGAGRAFSAGADRSLLDPAGDPGERARAGEEFTGLLRVLRTCDKPVLAAVNGLAVGFGCTLLLYCDLVLAVASARFRLPFTALGIAPEAGSSVLLPARARWDEGIWAMLSSEWFDAHAAQRLGLVWQVVPEAFLSERTAAAAATLAALDPAAVTATKRLLIAGRAEATESAIARELTEMHHLFDRRAVPPSPAPEEHQ